MTTQIQRRLVVLGPAHRGSDASLRILISLVGELADDVLLRERVEGGAERVCWWWFSCLGPATADGEGLTM